MGRGYTIRSLYFSWVFFWESSGMVQGCLSEFTKNMAACFFFQNQVLQIAELASKCPNQTFKDLAPHTFTPRVWKKTGMSGKQPLTFISISLFLKPLKPATVAYKTARLRSLFGVSEESFSVFLFLENKNRHLHPNGCERAHFNSLNSTCYMPCQLCCTTRTLCH